MNAVAPKSGKPTVKSFRVDGYAIFWPANFSWNGNMGPEVYPVMINQVEDTKTDATWKDGKMAWVWWRLADRPSWSLRDRSADFLLGAPGAIMDHNMPPHSRVERPGVRI